MRLINALSMVIYRRMLPPDDPKGTAPYLAVTREENLFVAWEVTSKGEWVIRKTFAKTGGINGKDARDEAITFAAMYGREE